MAKSGSTDSFRRLVAGSCFKALIFSSRPHLASSLRESRRFSSWCSLVEAASPLVAFLSGSFAGSRNGAQSTPPPGQKPGYPVKSQGAASAIPSGRPRKIAGVTINGRHPIQP